MYISIMEIKPIYKEPALLLNKNILLLADLHLGIECELRKSGINLPSQSDKIGSRILNLCAKYKIKKLIILGDVKHKVPGVAYQELYELRKVFEKILTTCKAIEIIPGNHDAGLSKILPSQLEIHSSKGIAIDGLGLFHGHAWPSELVLGCKELITAHIHPVIALEACFGTRIAEPCWVRARYKKKIITIMPAFNNLCGYAINKYNLKLRAPLSQLIKLEDASIYLLDGTLLGKLKELVK